MKYLGSKARFKKEILSFVLKDSSLDSYYVEPFCGGCNILDECSFPKKIGADLNFYLIEMWKALVSGWKPFKIEKYEYEEIRKHKENFPPHIIGYVGFACSYSGKWFGGFAGETKTKIGTIRDYQDETIRALLKQAPKLLGVDFICSEYQNLELPKNSIVYCDPPYRDTTKYDGIVNFNSDLFWGWVREQKQKVFVSEYSCPSDFICLWEQTAKSSLSANGKSGGNKISVEKLFIHERHIK